MATDRGRLSPTAILAMVATAVFITVANTSASAVSQPAIAQTFGAGPADVGWVVFGYSGTFAVATALYGRLSVRFGVGRTLSFGIFLLAFGSLVAVVAPALPVVIAARIIQGAGSGAIPTLSVAILATRFAPERRQFAYGIVTAFVGVAQALGPMIGGLLVDLISWRAAVAIGMLSLPIAFLIWYDLPESGDMTHSLDYRGAGSVLLMIGGLVYVLNRVPVEGATLLTGSALALAALGVWVTAGRAKHHPNPFLPPLVISDRGFLLLVTAGFVGSAAYLGTIVALPPSVSGVHEIGAVGIGLVLAPTAGFVALASTINGVAVRRLGHGTTTLISLLFLLVGTGLLAGLGIDRSLISVALILIPLGIGFGLLAPPLVDAVTSHFEGRFQSIAIGLFYLGFFLGGSSGGATTTGIIQRNLSIPPLGSAFAVGEALLAGLAVIGVIMMTRNLIRRRADGGEDELPSSDQEVTMKGPESMRAMALMGLGGLDQILDIRLPIPEPADDEVLIQVRTVGVNHQDLFTMSGRAHMANLSFPHVMGIDPSGVVADFGARVTSLGIGQRVVVKPPIACYDCDFCVRGEDDSCPSLHNVGVHRWGGHAEYVTVPERSVFPIASGLSHAKASALAHSFPVAEQMFTRVGLTGEDVVLVAGASGAIGSAAVQLAKLAGAFVIGAAGSPDRTARAAGAGSDDTIDYTAEPDFADLVRSIVPEGVTVFFDPAGNPRVWNEALKTLRNRARVVVCGSHAGPLVQLNNNWLFRSRVAIYGSAGSTRLGMRRCLDLAGAGRIDPAVDSVRPLDGIREAYADLGSRRNVGKIILQVGDESG